MCWLVPGTLLVMDRPRVVTCSSCRPPAASDECLLCARHFVGVCNGSLFYRWGNWEIALRAYSWQVEEQAVYSCVASQSGATSLPMRRVFELGIMTWKWRRSSPLRDDQSGCHGPLWLTLCRLMWEALRWGRWGSSHLPCTSDLLRCLPESCVVRLSPPHCGDSCYI